MAALKLSSIVQGANNHVIASIKCQSPFLLILLLFVCVQWEIWKKHLALPVMKPVAPPSPLRQDYLVGGTKMATMLTRQLSAPRYEELPKKQSSRIFSNQELLNRSHDGSTLPALFHHKWRANCLQIITGNETEIKRMVKVLNLERIFNHAYRLYMPLDADVRIWTQDCGSFKEIREYPTHSLSDEETAFPIAYIIVVHKKAAQVERLLRAIYQPQNIYCLHPDSKSSENFKRAIAGLANCLENVFVASRIETVQYAGFTRLLADINCMRDLTGLGASRYPWKYVINLCGEDFPLKSNLEIVRQLKSYNGHNDIGIETPPAYKRKWTRYHYVVKSGYVVRTRKLKKHAPHNMTVYAGLAYYIAGRQFAEYVVNNETAKDLLEWCSDTYSPDENFWVTLQGAAGTPGGRWQPPGGSVVRFIRWRGTSVMPKCRGRRVRSVCVFSAGYLQYLTTQRHLFANKFDYGFDPVALQCMAEHVKNRTYHPDVYSTQTPSSSSSQSNLTMPNKA